MRGVGLGGRNTDFGAGVDVHTAVGEEGNAGTNNIDDTDSQGTAVEAVSESHQRVGCFTRLGHKDAGVISEYWRLAIQEVGGKLDGNRNFGKLLKNTPDSHAAVVGSTASNEDNATGPANGGDVAPQTTECYCLVADVKTTTHGVDNRLGLLENFLLHEVVELALHDLLELELKGLDGTDIAASIGLLEAMDVERTFVDVGDVIVLEVHHLLGVLNNGRWIRRQEELGGHWEAIIGHEGAGLRSVKERLVGGSKQAVR